MSSLTTQGWYGYVNWYGAATSSTAPTSPTVSGGILPTGGAPLVAPVVGATPPTATPVLLPDLTLTGQAWGWPIPITAGRRTIPGRPIWRRVRKESDGYYADVAVSFGFRAEVLAGLAPVAMNFRRILANGAVVYDLETNTTPPGVTVTTYDGLQTGADPFLVSVDGADDVPAYIFHVYAVIQNLPLKAFANKFPDAWAAEIADVLTDSQVIPYANSADIVGAIGFGGADWVGNMMVDFIREKMWMATYGSGGIVLKEWSLTLRDSVLTHPEAPWGSFTSESAGIDNGLLGLPASGHLLMMPFKGSDRSSYTVSAVNPSTNQITAQQLITQASGTVMFGVMTGQATPPGRSPVDLIACVDATNTLRVYEYDGSAIVSRGSILLPVNQYPWAVSGVHDGATMTFFFQDWSPGSGGSALGNIQYFHKVTATYSSGTTISLSHVLLAGIAEIPFSDPAPRSYQGQRLLPTPDGGVILSSYRDNFTDGQTYSDFAKIAADGTVAWSTSVQGYASTPFTTGTYSGGNTSIITDKFLAFGYYNDHTHMHGIRYGAWAIDVNTGAATAYSVPHLEETFGDSDDPNLYWVTFIDRHQFDARVMTITATSWGGAAGANWDVVLGGTPGQTDGIALSRCYLLLANLTRELKGKIAIAPSITDFVSCLFIVEQGSFMQFAAAMNRLCNCDIRESNDGVEVFRIVDGVTYATDASVTVDNLLRQPGATGLMLSRAGDDAMPSEIRAQFVADEASFKYTERPARREFGPMQTTTTTRIDTLRVPLGMAISQGQQYVSETLYRETEMRAQVLYNVPWAQAISVQPGDVHAVDDASTGDVLTVKVTRADLTDNRTATIQGMRLHTAQEYNAQADGGSGATTFVPSSPTPPA